MRGFLKQPKKKLIFTLVMIGLLLAVFIPKPVAAGVLETIAELLGNIIKLLINAVGFFITIVISIIVGVAQYNGFIKAPVVFTGWLLMRDICNMFFILILLIIAFSTVLGYEKFHYSRTLAPLLIAAVVINFSKLICGLLIDLSQVIMLAFVAAFAPAQGGNFAELVGMQHLLGATKTLAVEGGSAGFVDLMVSYVLALILALVLLVVLIAMLAILVIRIVTLWFLVVLSPFAFFAGAVPNFQRYASQWWSEFGKQLMVGPIMAFFIWLSLSAVNKVNVEVKPPEIKLGRCIANICDTSTFLTYIIGIGLMYGSLMAAQQFGGLGGQIAGKAAGWLQKTAKAPVEKLGKTLAPVGQYMKGAALGVAGMAAKTPFALMGRGAKFIDKQMRKEGISFTAPIKKLQDAGKWLKTRAQEGDKRIAEGKGTWWDRTFSDTRRAWETTGDKDRANLNVLQLQNVEDTQKRLQAQGLTPERMEALWATSGKNIRLAAGTSLIDKKYGDDKEIERSVREKLGEGASEDKINEEIKNEKNKRSEAIKRLLDDAKGNPPLYGNLEKATQEKVSYDLLLKSLYNNLSTAENVKKHAKDLSDGKIKITDADMKLNKEQFSLLLNSLGKKQFLGLHSPEDALKMARSLRSQTKSEDPKVAAEATAKLEQIEAGLSPDLAKSWKMEDKVKAVQFAGKPQKVFTDVDLEVAIKDGYVRGKDFANVDYGDLTEKIKEIILKNIGVRGLAQMSDENPDLMKKLIEHAQSHEIEFGKLLKGLRKTEWGLEILGEEEGKKPKIEIVSH